MNNSLRNRKLVIGPTGAAGQAVCSLCEWHFWCTTCSKVLSNPDGFRQVSIKLCGVLALQKGAHSGGDASEGKKLSPKSEISCTVQSLETTR